MRRMFGVLLVCCLSLVALAQTPTNAVLSEVMQLKAENFQLRATLAEQRFVAARQVLFDLEKERAVLEAALVKALGGKDDDTFDWNTKALAIKKAKP